MSIARSIALVCVSAALAPFFASAQTSNQLVDGDTTASYSSSSSLPDTPSAPATLGMMGAAPGGKKELVNTRPFSTAAIGVKIGVAGVGFDVATPLSRRLNLRGGASFFSYSPNLTEDGETITGTLSFKTVGASLDIFPFAGAFRISPGVTLYNGNHLTANAAVPGGQSFTLNDVDYTSSTTNPVTGIFDVQLGKKAAPSLTIGWGNMIPHHAGQHWSVPFEIGAEYINTPQITLNLTGSACTSNGNLINCQPVATTPSIQANVAGEQAQLNSDIAPLRFYPILSIGVAYKFGGNK